MFRRPTPAARTAPSLPEAAAALSHSICSSLARSPAAGLFAREQQGSAARMQGNAADHGEDGYLSGSSGSSLPANSAQHVAGSSPSAGQ